MTAEITASFFARPLFYVLRYIIERIFDKESNRRLTLVAL